MDEIRDKNGLTLEQFLASYDAGKYERPSVTVDMAVFTLKPTEKGLALALLLIKRGGHPQLGWHALPGGFVEMDEDTLAAAARELYEETGIQGLPLRQFATFGAVDRDVRTRVITVAHYAVAPYRQLTFAAGDDAAEAGLYTVSTRLKAACASAELYGITLAGDTDTIECSCRLCYDELGSYTAEARREGLASDHAHVVFSALLALNRLPRRRVARLLALGAQEEEIAAIAALDHALCALPRRV